MEKRKFTSIYVAEAEAGDLLGYVSVHWLPYLFLPGPEGFVSELFIRKTARGQGVGTQLLQTVQTEAEQRGCSRLSLLNNRDRSLTSVAFTRSMVGRSGG